VLGYDWDWTVVWNYRYAFLAGLLTTFELTVLAVILGTILGLPTGLLLTTGHWLGRMIRPLLLGVTDILRALPILILLLLFYFWLPTTIGLRSAFWIAVAALSLNLAAFVADVSRGAISSVPRPLVEAGYSLGMSPMLVARRILLPEAVREIVPTLGLLYIDILKMSSLASVIAVQEVVHKASLISSSTYRYLEVYAVLAVLYIAVVLPFSHLVRRLERSTWFLRRS
jgi:polar amino acid transport system permease protein